MCYAVEIEKAKGEKKKKKEDSKLYVQFIPLVADLIYSCWLIYFTGTDFDHREIPKE